MTIDWKKSFWTLLVVVALVQSVALFKIVYDRDRLLKAGREITLPVQPLDPRDIFRGDYVTLGYDITSVKKSSTETDPDFSGFSRGSTAYVTLTPAPAGGWTLAHIGTQYPAQVGPGDVVIKGLVKSLWLSYNKAESMAVLRYGIETYFVPEGTGRALEDKVRTHKIEAIVAVGGDGTAALKGLVVDGERHVDPPLL
jgi:uncharacterized membrane-anchored protein